MKSTSALVVMSFAWTLAALSSVIGCNRPAADTVRSKEAVDAGSQSPDDNPMVGTSPNSPSDKSVGSSRTRTSGRDQAANTPLDIAANSSLPGTEEARSVQPLDEHFLFFPTKYPHGDWQPDGLSVEDLWLEADDGTKIHGWYCRRERARAVVLFAHGNGGNLSHRQAFIAQLQESMRTTLLIFDYRGYGRSEGVPTVEGILKDARAARTALAERAGVEESEIVLMGESLGGAVVVQLAAESAPRGLILDSTFSSLRDAARHHYPGLAWLVPEDKLNSVSRISAYGGPLLQFHGDADRTIPIALGRKLFEAAHEPKAFVAIAGGDHNDQRDNRYYSRLDHFLEALPGR